jgi:putative membrane protein
MDRRVVLAGLAAAAAAPAFAQTRDTPSSTPPAQTDAPATGGMSPGMGQADMQHMQETLRIGMLALETSKIALDKAQNQDLKQFAQFEMDEQETLSEVLHSMMEPATTAATGSSSSMSGSAMQLDAKGRDMIEKLRAAQAGSAFDRLFHQGQVEGHHELLQVQERYLQSNPQNREHMNVAKLARGRIREHIALLDNMQSKLR